MPIEHLTHRVKNLSFHNLCNHKKIPPLISKLLGLGHKFCIREKLPKNHLNETFERFTKSMRLKHWLHLNNMEDNGNYIPKIYVKTN